MQNILLIWWPWCVSKNKIAHIEVQLQIQIEQDPVSTMQKTGMTNYSSFVIWSGLEKGITYECYHYEAVYSHFSVYLAIFGMMTLKQSNKQKNNQPGDHRASLLLISEKAVCCNIHALIHWFFYIKQHDGMEYEDPESQNPAWQPCQRGRGTGRREVKKQFLNF